MFKSNLVMSIQCDKKFLSEKNGEVFLPFMSEYSVFLKNKNTRRAVISLEIDGKDVLNGSKIVLNGGESASIERFLEDSLTEGRKFRFIQKTKGILEHRGNQPEDGLIKVSFKYEKENKFIESHFPSIRKPSAPFFSDFEINCIEKRDFNLDSKAIFSNSICDNGGLLNAKSNFTKGFDSSILKQKKLEDGITVKGSESSQSFKRTSFVNTDGSEEFVMILKLTGIENEEEVVEPITKETKKICTVCGKKWDYSFTYCPEDASYLEKQ